MLRGLRQWHNAAGQIIQQAMVGDTAVFDVPGLPRQVWIEQTQNGAIQYNGVLSLPVQYTFLPRDVGMFEARLYDVQNGGKGPNLLYSYTFQVLAGSAQPTPGVLAPLPVAGSATTTGNLCAEVQYPDGSTQINGPLTIPQADYQRAVEAQGLKVLRFMVCGSSTSVPGSFQQPPSTTRVGTFNPNLTPAASGGSGSVSSVATAYAPSITPGLPGSVPTGSVVGQTSGGNLLTRIFRFYLWQDNGYATGANYSGCSKVNSSLCDPQWFGGSKAESFPKVLSYARSRNETPYEVFSADEPFQLIAGQQIIDPRRIQSSSTSSFPWLLIVGGGLLLLGVRRSS